MSQFLRDRHTRRRLLRDLVEGEGLTLAGGVYDALSARIAEAAGVEVLYMTGYGVAAAQLGVNVVNFGGDLERTAGGGRL